MGKKVDEMTEEQFRIINKLMLFSGMAVGLADKALDFNQRESIYENYFALINKVLELEYSPIFISLDENPKNFSQEYLKGFLEGQRHERKQKLMFTKLQEVYDRWKMREGHREVNVWATDMWLAIKEYCEVTK